MKFTSYYRLSPRVVAVVPTALLALAGGAGCGQSSDEENAHECPSSMTVGDICVDPSAGSDDAAAAGTGDAPVKTLTHALTMVGGQGAGRTVYLLPGIYDVAGGETLPISIATGITVEGVAPVAADTLDVSDAAREPAALIRGEGAVMVMHPGATLKRAIVISQGSSPAGFLADGATFGIQLAEVFFAGTTSSPFIARGGEIVATHVGLGPQVVVESTATVAGNHLAFTLGRDSIVDLQGDVAMMDGAVTFAGGGTLDIQASLTGTGIAMKGSFTDIDWGDHDPPYTVVLRDHPSVLDLTGGSIDGLFVGALSAPNYSHLTLSGVDILRSQVFCSDTDCSFDGGTYTDSMLGVSTHSMKLTSSHLIGTRVHSTSPNKVVVRSCTFGPGSQIKVSSGYLDLGMTGDLGNNTFEGEPGGDKDSPNLHHTFVNLDQYNGLHTPWGVGNTWLPHEGEADGAGHYPPGPHYGALDDKNVISHAGFVF